MWQSLARTSSADTTFKRGQSNSSQDVFVSRRGAWEHSAPANVSVPAIIVLAAQRSTDTLQHF